jgi:hypothetical protein
MRDSFERQVHHQLAPLWRRHRLMFISATVLPLGGALLLALTSSSSITVIKADNPAKIELKHSSPVPILNAPAKYTPKRGQAVLIPTASNNDH